MLNIANLKASFAHKDESAGNLRLMVISPIVSMPKETKEQIKARKELINKVADDNDISVKTIKRWLKLYAEKGAKGLESQYCRTSPLLIL